MRKEAACGVCTRNVHACALQQEQMLLCMGQSICPIGSFPRSLLLPHLLLGFILRPCTASATISRLCTPRKG